MRSTRHTRHNFGARGVFDLPSRWGIERMQTSTLRSSRSFVPSGALLSSAAQPARRNREAKTCSTQLLVRWVKKKTVFRKESKCPQSGTLRLARADVNASMTQPWHYHGASVILSRPRIQHNSKKAAGATWANSVRDAKPRWCTTARMRLLSAGQGADVAAGGLSTAAHWHARAAWAPVLPAVCAERPGAAEKRQH